MVKEEILNKLIINKEKKKCFIFDLDGTIIFNNSMLSKNNERLLNRILEHGHEVIFATGRSYRDFKIVMPEPFHNHKVTLFSGCLSMGVDGTIYKNTPLPKNLVEDIIQRCLENKYPFIMDNISHYYYPPFKGFKFGFITPAVMEYLIDDLDHMLATDIYKILIFDMQQHGFFTQYALENNLQIKHHSYDNCFDIVVRGCDKYDGLLPLLGNYDLDDIFVFGNDFNDYEMLLNFPNSIVFGTIGELQQISKLNILYDDFTDKNLDTVINTIL